MMRSTILICAIAAGAGVTQAAPVRKATPFDMATVQPELPVPPIPPQLPPAFTAAPVPNSHARGPVEIDPQGVKVRPDVFSPKNFDRGDGYLYGSNVQNEQERKLKPMPGLRLNMPLE